MRVMRVIAGNFSTNVEKVSKEEIQVNVYGWKLPRNHPHHPQTNSPRCQNAGPSWHLPIRVMRGSNFLVWVGAEHSEHKDRHHDKSARY